MILWDVESAIILALRAADIAQKLRNPLFLALANTNAWSPAVWAGDWDRANHLATADFERTGDEELYLGRKIVIQAQVGPKFSGPARESSIDSLTAETRYGLAIVLWISSRDDHQLEL